MYRTKASLLIPLALRCQIWRQIRVVCRDGKQRGEQRQIENRNGASYRERPLQLLNLSVRRVVTIETGCVFQMADDRVIRAVDIVGRTLTADNRVPLACNAVRQSRKIRDLPMPGSPQISAT